jgi:putative spermidine/putrescine transport system permease protein
MTTATTPAPQPASAPVAVPGARRRLSAALYRRPRLQLALVLGPPLGWLVIAYLGSLAVMLVSSFFQLDTFTFKIIPELTLENYAELFSSEVYRTITIRTLGIAAAVTVTCALIAFPIAYYMARIAGPRARGILTVSVLLPLWSSYLVKVYAWYLILGETGPLNWLLAPLGLRGPGYGEVAVWLVFTYLWLPYMILPVYAGLQRIPNSLLEASSDLGGHAGTTFRRVILPLVLPAVVAGSIFTFSLTLGDYITPSIVSSTQFIGNVVYREVGVSGNLPFAAAFATVPILIMLVYLLVARRLGAFDSL